MAIELWGSVEDVAAHLGATNDSTYRWNDERGLPARKLGRVWKCELSQIDAWVEAGGEGEGPSDDGEKDR